MPGPSLKSDKAAVSVVRACGRQRATQHQRGETESNECTRCGKRQHPASECPYIDVVCRYCGKKSHLCRVCRKRLADEKPVLKPTPAPRRVRQGRTRKEDAQLSDEEMSVGVNLLEMTQNTSSTRCDSPLLVEPTVNGVSLRMEVDTGAAVSVISHATYRQLSAEFPLQDCSTRVSTYYTGEPMKVCGQFPVKVNLANQESQQVLLVMENPGHPLFGRDWLQSICLDWSACPQVHSVPNGRRISSAADM